MAFKMKFLQSHFNFYLLTATYMNGYLVIYGGLYMFNLLILSIRGLPYTGQLEEVMWIQ